ncbi:MAG: tetratricopeptide repeat protein [Rubricoccaceae bacterium]|nr:tetratricopeptide repeat protein [Rubricoccaceae bacterium]
MNRLLILSFAFLLAVPLAQAQRIPVTTDSDAARAHYVRGLHNAIYLNFDRARPHLDAALAADPDFALAHLYRGWLSPAEKRAEHLRQANAHAATDAERQMIEGYEAQLRQDYDRQRELLTALAERYPDDPLPMFFLASTESFNQGRDADAVASARRSLAADPSFAAAYNVIGYAEMAQGNTAAAEEAFREQIRLAPDEPNPYDSYGDFLMNAGRLDEAERQFELALTKDPTFDVARANLTRVAIMRATEAHHAGINSQDADTAAETYTAGAVLSPPDGSQIVGHDAIRELLDGYYAAGNIQVGGEMQEIMPMGDDYAYSRAALTVRVDGAVAEQGINSYIWVKTADGWKVARDTWTSAPLPGGTN